MMDKVIGIDPDVRPGAHANRAFLRRVVRFLIDQGIDQFLDLGSGIPTVGNVHEIAQQANPAARVAYVDFDPVTVAHSQAILKHNPSATIIQSNVCQPERILGHAEVKRLIDFSRPAAILMLAILHYVSDNDQAQSILRTLRGALASGSYVALSHFTCDGAPPGVIERMAALATTSSNPARARTRAEVARLFEGVELVEPGLVYTPLWRPEEPDDVLLDQPERSLAFAGVGRKP
jgi:hypothetical protein